LSIKLKYIQYKYYISHFAFMNFFKVTLRSSSFLFSLFLSRLIPFDIMLPLRFGFWLLFLRFWFVYLSFWWIFFISFTIGWLFNPYWSLTFISFPQFINYTLFTIVIQTVNESFLTCSSCSSSSMKIITGWIREIKINYSINKWEI